jgi:hypothetical protein
LDDAERTPRKLNQFNHVKASSVRSTAAIYGRPGDVTRANLLCR